MISAINEELSAEIDRQTAEQLAREMDGPVHRAKCAECAHAVDFRSTASGRSFILVDPAPDAVYGVGESGRPICPNGHGEMALADDQFKPAAEAFALAQDQLDAAEEPLQRRLPGIVPVFNFQGAYLELETKAMEVDRLHREYKDAAEVAREAKKDWDKAAELYTSMALELRRRRREKDGEPKDAADLQAEIARVPCAWELAHIGAPDGCPLCNDRLVANLVSRLLSGDASAAPDAAGHVEEVDRVLTGMEVERVVDSLDSIETIVSEAVVREWTAEERQAVLAWSEALFDKQQGVESVTVPDRPKVLGRPHIPAEAHGGAPQVCSICEVVLVPGGGDAHDYHRVTDLVGVDCPGKVVEEGHRYPQTGKKKPAAKKTRAKSKAKK
jgi:hypothetical protein